MKSKALLTLLLFCAASDASADSRTLRWSRLAVTAHLDGDGRLHVQERHSIVFNGDWNGGERTFRSSLQNALRLERISRIDPSGRAIPLHEDKSLAHVDDYAWHNSNTLRWRSRLPSDPPFHHQEITYLLEYTDGNILIPTDGSYLLDHNFGLPDLQWPIDVYSLDLSLDPVWQPLDAVPKQITRSSASHGENVTVTAHLRYSGARVPAAVNLGAPASLRYALLALLLGGAALFAWLFFRRERALGRFKPLPDPASIDRRWLDEHVFKFLPEVVGAAWDDRTGAAEVAAVIARMVQEGKLSSRIEKRGLFKGDDLVLTLLRKKDSFDGYEASLINSLFFDGDTTGTEKIKAHYKSKGFDPVSKIRDPLQRKAREIGKQGRVPKIDWKPTLILALAGVALLVLAAFSGPLNIVAGAVAVSIMLLLYVAGLFGALDYRRRLSNLGVSALEFVPAILLIVGVAAAASAAGFRLSTFTLAGLVLVSLAAIRSLFNLAKSREAGDRLETRRQLTAAREYFARELRRPNPALDDAWFPYLLAFGLGANVDRWFHSFGGSSNVASSFGSSSHSTSTSSPSSTSASGWTGGGGAFGGAGASGSFAVAAAGMAAGVAAPSSGGSGGGGGGSSGGGGGGGW
jgi:uncharacterized membrane protein YgcG